MATDSPAKEWQPDARLVEIITLCITGRRENFEEARRQKREAVNAKLAGRGMAGSGLAAKVLLEELKPAFEQYADGIVSDLLNRFRELGPVSPEAARWIRTKFEEVVMDFGPRLASAIADQQVRGSGDRAHDAFAHGAYAAKRRLEQELLMADLKSQMAAVERVGHSAAAAAATVDVFICHASENKHDAAVPIAQKLTEAGFSVWIDQAMIKVGDTLLAKIEEGLRSCRYAIVLVSPEFFQKHWTKTELAALATLQELRGRKVMLPVWHQITKEEVAKHSLILASIFSLTTANGIDSVAAAIAEVLREPD